MLDKIKGAIFDMDGTLINSLICWDIFWEDLGKKFLNKDGFRPTDEDDKAARTLTAKHVSELLHNKYDIADTAEEILGFWEEFVEKFYREVVEAKEGVFEFLDELQSRGVKMCLASATDKHLLMVAIEKLDLGKYFSELFSCGDIGKGKEEPDIFLIAKEHLGTNLEETCVFEDSCVAVKTANKAGFKTVAIYDAFNYGQDEMKQIADEYIEDGETLMKLVK